MNEDMKKGFIAFVKALFGVAKVVLAILGVLVLAAVASALLSIPKAANGVDGGC